MSSTKLYSDVNKTVETHEQSVMCAFVGARIIVKVCFWYCSVTLKSEKIYHICFTDMLHAAARRLAKVVLLNISSHHFETACTSGVYCHLQIFVSNHTLPSTYVE